MSHIASSSDLSKQPGAVTADTQEPRRIAEDGTPLDYGYSAIKTDRRLSTYIEASCRKSLQTFRLDSRVLKDLPWRSSLITSPGTLAKALSAYRGPEGEEMSVGFKRLEVRKYTRLTPFSRPSMARYKTDVPLRLPRFLCESC